jgi:hypothetical protein
MCIGIDRATSGNVALDFTVKEFLATIRNPSGARMHYGFGCDSAAQACLIAIRLSGKTQIDWSALCSRSFSSFNSTKRASSALAMTISRQRRYGSFCASRIVGLGFWLAPRHKGHRCNSRGRGFRRCWVAFLGRIEERQG